MKFELQRNGLSTPEGLKDACERARSFVEEHVPGEHKPGGGSYWWGRPPSGCRCALGYLLAAIEGKVSLENEIYAADLMGRFGLRDTSRAAFANGFDAVYEAVYVRIADEGAWETAGRELAEEWRKEQNQ